MSQAINWTGVEPIIKDRAEPFSDDLLGCCEQEISSLYLIGSAARGELGKANPEIQLLIVCERFTTDTLDKIAGLGKKHGAKGIRAPLLLTPEYIDNAGDAFPMELFELSKNNKHLYGEDSLRGISVSNVDLRIQLERELRMARLQLRQAYLRSAGDGSWLLGWMLDRVADLFPIFRASLELLGEDSDHGNTDAAGRLGKVAGVDMSSVVELWEARKKGKAPDKHEARRLFEQWDGLFEALVEKIDALSV